MTSPPSLLQVALLEEVALVFAGREWDRQDLARLTATGGSGLVSPAQDLLVALQVLSDLDFGTAAIPRRFLPLPHESKR